MQKDLDYFSPEKKNYKISKRSVKGIPLSCDRKKYSTFTTGDQCSQKALDVKRMMIYCPVPSMSIWSLAVFKMVRTFVR